MLLGLVGHPVKHSLSPQMHRAALAHFRMPGDYRLLDLAPEKIERGVADLLKEGFAGFNVTIPHKQTFYRLSADLTKEAHQLKAVNTVKVVDSQRLLGHNTDVGGFIEALSEDLPYITRGSTACVLGAGGAARAAVWGLMQLGWPKVQIIARRLETAQEIVDEIAAGYPDAGIKYPLPRFAVSACDLSGLQGVCDLLVNCTPIGLLDDEAPEWFLQLLKWTNPYGTFFDMVYGRNGQPTMAMKEAKRLRLNCLDGTSMLVRQAALSFEFWTGKSPPLAVMAQAIAPNRTSDVTSISIAGRI